jgi:hypothetical protein
MKLSSCYLEHLVPVNIYFAVGWENEQHKLHNGISVRIIRINVGDDSRPLTIRKTL